MKLTTYEVNDIVRWTPSEEGYAAQRGATALVKGFEFSMGDQWVDVQWFRTGLDGNQMDGKYRIEDFDLLFSAKTGTTADLPKIFEAVRPKHDPVLKPAHYARWKMEPLEFISVNDLPFWFANVVKYCSRYDAKDGLQDLYKARAYLDIKIRQLEGHKEFWVHPVAEQQKLACQDTQDE